MTVRTISRCNVLKLNAKQNMKFMNNFLEDVQKHIDEQNSTVLEMHYTVINVSDVQGLETNTYALVPVWAVIRTKKDASSYNKQVFELLEQLESVNALSVEQIQKLNEMRNANTSGFIEETFFCTYENVSYDDIVLKMCMCNDSKDNKCKPPYMVAQIKEKK